MRRRLMVALAAIAALACPPPRVGENRRVPLHVSSPQFIGRQTELAALSAALDCAVAGRFQALFVAGESGVGKSRLLQELERAKSCPGDWTAYPGGLVFRGRRCVRLQVEGPGEAHGTMLVGLRRDCVS